MKNNLSEKEQLFIVLSILFILAISVILTYSIKEGNIVTKLNSIALDIEFNPEKEISFKNDIRILHSPYVAFFLTEQDKINYVTDDRILQYDLGFFKKVSSIKSILFISCPVADSRQYNHTVTKYKGGSSSTTSNDTELHSYDVNIWAYDCETKTIVAFKQYKAPTLKDSYFNEFPRTVTDAEINSFIQSLLIADE